MSEIIDGETGPTTRSIRLVCVAGADVGKTFQLAASTLAIGRGRTADLQLSGFDVSRRHALLTVKGCDVELQDLDSAHGTFVNGARIRQPASLQIGDRIQVGNAILLVTYYDELEARTQRMQRVEAMASMAAGLAHDFRNALMVILAGLEVFDESLPADAHELRDAARDMRSATTTATALAKRLLNIGRREPTAHDRINLADIVNESAQMARRLLGKSISLAVTIGNHLTVQGSREELGQVTMNLLMNAKDAMPDGGRITIIADAVALDGPSVLTCQLPARGRYVEMRVADTGIGMDEHTLARAFEPFFTTKPPNQGSGLGLAVVHSIVKRHGGSVLVESSRGRGTTFRIFLPLFE